MLNKLFDLTIDFQTVTFNALVCWALLSLMLDFYDTVKKVVTNATIRTRLLCPKCFALWFTLFFTGNIFTALIVSFLVNFYFCHLHSTSRKL